MRISMKILLSACIVTAFLSACGQVPGNMASDRQVHEQTRVTAEPDLIDPEGELATYCASVLAVEIDMRTGATCLALSGGQAMRDYSGPGLADQSEFMRSMGSDR